jgi:hypothetical protein
MLQLGQKAHVNVGGKMAKREHQGSPTEQCGRMS